MSVNLPNNALDDDADQRKLRVTLQKKQFLADWKKYSLLLPLERRETLRHIWEHYPENGLTFDWISFHR